MATVTIRLSDETRDRIAEAAQEQGVQMSDYIRGALELHLSMEPSEDLGVDRPDREISLSPYERKVLQLLHRNLLATQGGLDAEDGSYYSHEAEVRSLKVLENGYVGEYDREFVDISEQTSQAECALVWDIFDMFRVIQASVRKLGEDGWSQIQVKAADRYGTFRGFDFNDSVEVRLADYAKYLIKTDRWTELEGAFSRENDGGNSHRRMLPTYRAMLKVFKPTWRQAIRGGLGRGYFSAQDVEKVLMAAPGAERTTQDSL